MHASGTNVSRLAALGRALVVALVAAAIAAACLLAPTEATMGQAQRIVYLHVPLAWLALLGMLVAAGAGAMYLARRTLAWDHAAQAAAELGWLCAGLTLISGALWAHEAWGVWWTWEPRLTTAFVLWMIYSGLLLVRSQLADRRDRARLGAVLAIVGAMEVPLVVLAAHWFRGIHPAATEMEPSMWAVLALNLAAFSALFALLFAERRAQLQLEDRLESLLSQWEP